jgi:hypothetical protein
MGAAQQAALIEAFGQTEGRIRAQLLAFVLGMYDGLGAWRDSDVARFVRIVVPVVVGAQRQVGSLVDAYVAAMLADMLGVSPRPSGSAARAVAAVRGGVDPAEVYARPFRTLWQALKDGKDFPAALAQGRLRAWQLAATDLQLAKTHAMRAAFSADDRVVGYRRVLKGKSCGLCVVASTQRYHRSQLMPIHPGCDCGTAPIVAGHDPGQVINRPLLENVHAAVADRFGAFDATGRKAIDYRDLLVTHEHGEIGPVLARKGQQFTGPGDLAT